MVKYKKTAKDLAHERDIAKLRHTITNLEREVNYWKECAKRRGEYADAVYDLYLKALELLGLSEEDFQKHVNRERKLASLSALITTAVETFN